MFVFSLDLFFVFPLSIFDSSRYYYPFPEATLLVMGMYSEHLPLEVVELSTTNCPALLLATGDRRIGHVEVRLRQEGIELSRIVLGHFASSFKDLRTKICQ